MRMRVLSAAAVAMAICIFTFGPANALSKIDLYKLTAQQQNGLAMGGANIGDQLVGRSSAISYMAQEGAAIDLTNVGITITPDAAMIQMPKTVALDTSRPADSPTIAIESFCDMQNAVTAKTLDNEDLGAASHRDLAGAKSFSPIGLADTSPA